MKDCRDVAIELGLDVPDGPFLPLECCNSCHDDANEGYEELVRLRDDGDDVYVCCAILRLMPDEY